MAESRDPQLLGWRGIPWDAPPPRTPGVLGWMDGADPAFMWTALGNTPGPLGVNDAPGAKADPAPAGRPTASGDGPLEVGEGQITFDAEGSDNPKSPYYSLKIVWPGNDESGVTIGRGYDMGNRTTKEVQDDLVGSGMDEATAKKFAEGAGKKGANAKKFVDDKRESLGEMTREVQKALFKRIYPAYVERAKANYEKWTKDEKDRKEWTALDQAIRDVLVDLVYQGFTKGASPMTKGMKNDYDEFIKYIEDSATLKQYEAGRHRADYLRAHKPAK